VHNAYLVSLRALNRSSPATLKQIIQAAQLHKLLHNAELWFGGVSYELYQPRVVQATANIDLALEVLDQLRLLLWVEILWEDHLLDGNGLSTPLALVHDAVVTFA
jgi:hypothetical protein